VAVELRCPACRRVEDGRLHSAVVDVLGRCQACGVVWPLLTDLGGTVPGMLADRAATQQAWDTALDVLENLMPRADDPEARPLLDLLATWGPVHWGRHAQPPMPSADPSWLHGWLDVDLPPGPILVLGCGPGADLVALGRLDREVVAMDASAGLVALARHLAWHRTPWLPMHRDALRFAFRPVQLPDLTRDQLRQVTWICGDALDPPFAAETFAAVVALNLLDAVPEPLMLLGQCEALLQPGGALLVASPYHFQAQVTPGARQLLQWIPEDLDLPAGLERLCTGQAIADFLDTLSLERRAVDIPWQVPVHPGFVAQYRLHAMLLRKGL
jgi:SAM-dependent methyltransferase